MNTARLTAMLTCRPNTKLKKQQFYLDRTALEVAVCQDVVDGRVLFHRSQMNNAHVTSASW